MCACTRAGPALMMTNELRLEQAAGIRNVFVKDWKPNFYNDIKKQIASLAFMRNIIEHTKGEQDPDYLKLTSLLHWKHDTESIKVDEVDAIFNSFFKQKGASQDPKEPAFGLINKAAEGCLVADDGVNFENKIVLAIATRLAAEKYMIAKIAINRLWPASTQTRRSSCLPSSRRNLVARPA